MLYRGEGSQTSVSDVHVAINLDTILISTSRAHYDPSRERYFAFANATVVVLAMPTTGTLPGKWEFETGNGTLVVTTDWPSEMRSFLRTLYIFTKEELVVKECDGREGACNRVCPPLWQPHRLRLPQPPIRAQRQWPEEHQGIHVLPAKVAFALAGLVRSVQFTGSALIDLILARHQGNAHVYVSTWNIIGQMNKGVFGFGDKIVPASRVSALLKGIYDTYLKDSDVLNYEQYKPLLDALSVRQLYYGGGEHIHISNVIRMIRESEGLYDMIVITRPDVFWNSYTQFISTYPNLHIKVS